MFFLLCDAAITHPPRSNTSSQIGKFPKVCKLISRRNLKTNQTWIFIKKMPKHSIASNYLIPTKNPICLRKKKLPPSSSHNFFRCSTILAWPKLPLPISSPKSKTSKTVSFDWWGWGVAWNESKKMHQTTFFGSVVKGWYRCWCVLEEWKKTSSVESGEQVHSKDTIQHFFRFNDSLSSHPENSRESHNQPKNCLTSFI